MPLARSGATGAGSDRTPQPTICKEEEKRRKKRIFSPFLLFEKEEKKIFDTVYAVYDPMLVRREPIKIIGSNSDPNTVSFDPNWVNL